MLQKKEGVRVIEIIVDNEITLKNAPSDFKAFCESKYVVPNPDYEKKVRMGLWVGNTPKKMFLYKERGDDIVLPFGTLDDVYLFFGEDIRTGEVRLRYDIELRQVNYDGARIPLYDYQEVAVWEMMQHSCGILQAPAGSGKTQMGLAFILERGEKALWLTHTKDLLQQSYDRAAQYIDKGMLGKITEGKVQIGSGITFATVQTMANMDLEQFKREWGIVIVDECHRVAGSPGKFTQFGKVLNALSAEKFGLSATVHRADGLIQATFAMLGRIAYTVPEEAVKGKIEQVRVVRRDTGTPMHSSCQDTDGTLLYGKLIDYLCKNEQRNKKIVWDLMSNDEHYNLILSDRVEHLKTLCAMLPEELQEIAFVVDGKTKSPIRNRVMHDMREGGKVRYLFATYKLAKEGLDIPRLDRLYLTTPQKDYAVITQSIGRIARHFDGKGEPVAYDYVDDIRFCEYQFAERKKSYKKLHCKMSL